MKIGVVSDTHIPGAADRLPRALLEGLDGVDLILHAGDIVEVGVLDELREVAEARAVRGNMDRSPTGVDLTASMVFPVENCIIGLVHGSGPPEGLERRALASFDEPVDVVVFGHSHLALCRRIGDVLAFNPGSPTTAEFRSYGILEVTDDEVRGRIVRLDDGES